MSVNLSDAKTLQEKVLKVRWGRDKETDVNNDAREMFTVDCDALTHQMRQRAASFPNNLSSRDFSYGRRWHTGSRAPATQCILQSSRSFRPDFLVIIIRALFRDQIWFYLSILFSRKALLKRTSPRPVSLIFAASDDTRAKRGVRFGH